MPKPIDATVAELVALLNDDLLELFEERAAVREYDGGHSRAVAEPLALLDVLDRFPNALSHVTVFAFDMDRVRHYIVATDEHRARVHVAHSGADSYGLTDVSRVVSEQFGGVAELTSVR